MPAPYGFAAHHEAALDAAGHRYASPSMSTWSPARRDARVPGVLGAVAFLLAFAQRPGWATADTKINLHVDPGRFLADVASMWTSTGQLGDVQTGQQAGYLFPMGPFFAVGRAIGLSDWVVQRLWLGTVLALAAIGMA